MVVSAAQLSSAEDWCTADFLAFVREARLGDEIIEDLREIGYVCMEDFFDNVYKLEAEARKAEAKRICRGKGIIATRLLRCLTERYDPAHPPPMPAPPPPPPPLAPAMPPPPPHPEAAPPPTDIQLPDSSMAL